MFSKVSKCVTKSAIYQQKRGVSAKNTALDYLQSPFLHYFNSHNTRSQNYKVASFNPLLPLEGHQPVIKQSTEGKFQVSKLKNGITVVTETAPFPNVVDLGILLDVGIRDETKETSGSLLSIKNTYFKTVLNTNEAINYGMVQMSGGDYFMDFDQENTYFNAHCLSHDVVDIFNMVADCATEPRSAVAADLGIWKNQETHKLESYLQTGHEFNDLVMQIAYNGKGLGMPLSGHRSNVHYLNAHVLQKFQLDNINPSRIFVGAAGIENHGEFVELVESKLGFIPAVDGNTKQREQSTYVGGDARTLTESNDIQFALVFESVNWKDSDMIALNVVNCLLGQALPNAKNAHGKGINSRLNKNLSSKHAFIDTAHALNFHFSDSGIFGIYVSGAASNAKQILEATTEELRSLTKTIAPEELQRAKNTLKSYCLASMERQTDRIEEAIKNVKVFGNVRVEQYCAEVDKVTSEQINKAIAKILTKTPTFVARGGNISQIPSFDKIQNSLKL